METRHITQSPAETEALGAALGRTLRPGAVVALTGGLGAGKTAFVRGLALGLGLSDQVTSPTFAIVHEYRNGPCPLFHFDMYRLSGPEELFDIGWEDYLDAGGVAAVEWSENVAAAMPTGTLWVDLEILDEHRRRVTLRDGGEGGAP